MNEQELRALVRDAIAAHHGANMTQAPQIVPALAARQHFSHALFVLPSGADTDGPCLIEPAVPCNHCAYCQSLGH